MQSTSEKVIYIKKKIFWTYNLVKIFFFILIKKNESFKKFGTGSTTTKWLSLTIRKEWITRISIFVFLCIGMGIIVGETLHEFKIFCKCNVWLFSDCFSIMFKHGFKFILISRKCYTWVIINNIGYEPIWIHQFHGERFWFFIYFWKNAILRADNLFVNVTLWFIYIFALIVGVLVYFRFSPPIP